MDQLQNSKLPDSEKDKIIAQSKADIRKAENKNFQLSNSLADCMKKPKIHVNCPNKNQESPICSENKQNATECSNKQEKTLLTLIISSVAFVSLTICNLVSCCNSRKR